MFEIVAFYVIIIHNCTKSDIFSSTMRADK